MKKLIIYTGMALGLLIPGLLRGQEIGLLRVNPDSLVSQREAAVWGGIEEGQFRPSHGASLQWSAGADVKGVRHGKSSSWTGALSVEQTTGYHMTSSMLLEPGYFPLDFVEIPQGTKSRQDVCLEGGVLSDFGYDWAAGIKASAKGSLVSKQQNIQHKGFGLDLQVEPTFSFVMDDDMGLASAYVLRLRTENLKATLGGDKIFFDKGLRYGSYVEDQSLLSIMEFSHGISELFYSPELTLGAEILWKRGQAGEGKYKFPGSTISVFAEYAVLADKADHIMRAGYKRQRDQLREVVDDGFNSLSDRKARNLDLKYEARFLHGALKSAGVVLDGNQWVERAFVSSPNQVRRLYGSATFLMGFSAGVIDLDLNFMAGKGKWQDRGRTALGDGSPEPDRMTDNWLRNMDYQMVARTGLGGTLTCRIPSVKGLYAQLYAYWYHAYNVTNLPGQNREIGTLKIGYKF
jgi:hypothetical protein